MRDHQIIDIKRLPCGRSLANNTILNLIGQLVPMIVGIFTIPALIKHLGTDRFAIITIAWMLIGYFSLFDMGLGRALTQLIAEKLGNNEHEDIPSIFWTSVSLMLMFSVIGSLIIVVLSDPLVHCVLKIPVSLQPETVSALCIMAISTPFVILTSAFVGFLTAYQRFDIINAIRIPMGVYIYAAPLTVLSFCNNMVIIISALLFGRVVAFFIHLFCCIKIEPDLRTKIILQKSIIRHLFKFGRWMTVSNLISPFMVYFDRFLIGSIVSISAVAYYATPYEFITKLLIIPGAFITVLFPTFASTYTRDPAYAAELYGRSVKYLFLLIFPMVFIVVVGAHQGITLWLGSEFANSSYHVLQLLAVGVFINCLAQVPFSFLQGIGKPDVTAKLHVTELALYIPMLWLLVKSDGIIGAAIAWSVRVAIDAALLFYVTRRSLQSQSIANFEPV